MQFVSEHVPGQVVVAPQERRENERRSVRAAMRGRDMMVV